MTEEEKQILLKDLSARLPYGVKVLNTAEGLNEISVLDSIFLGKEIFVGLHAIENIMTGLISVKPYLRPLSSMTEDEERELEETLQYTQYTLESYDWLNAHHFDYRGLIEKGLALESKEGMYKNEQL